MMPIIMLVFVNYAYFSKKRQKFLLLLFTLNKVAVKVFWYSFSEDIPMFFNRFKSDFILSRIAIKFSLMIDYRLKFVKM